MYAVKMIIGLDTFCTEAETADEIMQEMEQHQHFGCLLDMGRKYESAARQKELDKLEAFLEKYADGELTIDDIKNLCIRLSVGDIRCAAFAEGNGALSAVRAAK